MVLGVNNYGQILLPGLKRNNTVLLQQTVFGWTVSGHIPADPAQNPRSISAVASSLLPLEENMHYEELLGVVQRFWAIEQIPQSKRLSTMVGECERLFLFNHSRNRTGRYIVPLPVRKNKLQFLGESLSQARVALSAMHRRMQKDSKLREAYCSFMGEYLQLGHMRALSPKEISRAQGPVCYLTHHGGRRETVV